MSFLFKHPAAIILLRRHFVFGLSVRASVLDHNTESSLTRHLKQTACGNFTKFTTLGTYMNELDFEVTRFWSLRSHRN